MSDTNSTNKTLKIGKQKISPISPEVAVKSLILENIYRKIQSDIQEQMQHLDHCARLKSVVDHALVYNKTKLIQFLYQTLPSSFYTDYLQGNGYCNREHITHLIYEKIKADTFAGEKEI